MARPPAQSRLVDTLEGDDLAKRRLKAVLQTITGERSIADACARLGIGATALFELRTRALYGALAGLAPGAPGRPVTPAEDPEVAALRTELAQKDRELQVERLRTQLALHAILQPGPRLNSLKKRLPKHAR
jgi:transposase-like protein